MSVKKDYTFTRKMPESLDKLRNDGTFCDVILRSGLREVYAHRIILATLSDYFTVLFKYEGGFEKPAIHFDEDLISGECLENIVNYAYKGEIHISEENVCDLLLTADYFDIPFIKAQCAEFLNELQRDAEIINLDNLLYLIWIACHFKLTTFLGPICNFVSKHFKEIYEGNILLALSPHCLLSLLQEKDLTVLYNGIPADDVEFELFKFVVTFIYGNDLTHNIITEILQLIQLPELTHEQFSSVVGSSGCTEKRELITRVFNFCALPRFIDEEDVVSASAVERKYSKKWKFVDGLETSTETALKLDDRVHRIKIYTTTVKFVKILPDMWVVFRNECELEESITKIKAISLTYSSGKTVLIGDIPMEHQFDNVNSHEFILEDNEVIVKISKTYGNLDTIKFETNLGNEIGPIGKEINSNTHLGTFSPKTDCGYFHSFGQNSTINNLNFLWVEFSDPRVREHFNILRQLHNLSRMNFLQAFNYVAVEMDDSDDNGMYEDDYIYYDDSSPYCSDSDY